MKLKWSSNKVRTRNLPVRNWNGYSISEFLVNCSRETVLSWIWKKKSAGSFQQKNPFQLWNFADTLISLCFITCTQWAQICNARFANHTGSHLVVFFCFSKSKLYPTLYSTRFAFLQVHILLTSQPSSHSTGSRMHAGKPGHFTGRTNSVRKFEKSSISFISLESEVLIQNLETL